jgi:hypothetical protein
MLFIFASSFGYKVWRKPERGKEVYREMYTFFPAHPYTQPCPTSTPTPSPKEPARFKETITDHFYSIHPPKSKSTSMQCFQYLRITFFREVAKKR